MTEDQLQAKCFQWFHNTFPDHRGKLWATPNGGTRNMIEAAKFKATGLVKGVHDLCLYHNRQFHTFELKVGANKLTPEQVKWKFTMEKEGAMCWEIRDFETFCSIISQILSV